MRAILTTLGDLIGLAAVTVGAGLIYVPAGWIVGGLAVLIVSYATAEPGEPE